MAVELEIRDGDPWYLSPDIWTVPGSNPEGSPGTPIAGQSCYLWARVRNNGSTPVTNATVRFYWANPAVGFDRTTATLVGSSFVTLDAGEDSDVLCLTPWVPVFVNDGHECVLAEAFHESWDPLPNTNAFNVSTDRHVAQRNISVLLALRGMFTMAFEIHNPSRKKRAFQLHARQVDLDGIEPIMHHFGRDFQFPEGEGRISEMGFVRQRCPGEEDLGNAEPVIDELVLAPYERAGLSLIGRLEGEAALLNVEQVEGDVVIGGLSALVLQEREQDARTTSQEGS